MASITVSPVDPDVSIVHSTYEDNPFLPKDYVRELEKLINEDENYYNVYALGHWGVLTERVFTNYQVIPELPKMENAHWAYGLDFGLVNPSAILKCYLHDNRFYLDEVLYKSGLTNPDIIEVFSHEARGDIYGDPSSKQMIEEIRRAGYQAFEGHKGVKETIDLCQRSTLLITERSANLIKEIRSYKWKKDKAGHVLPEPVKWNDHAVDCMRYAVWGLTERFGFSTQRPQNKEPIESLSFRGEANPNQKILDRWMRKK
jgi:phage terminase large subunit